MEEITQLIAGNKNNRVITNVQYMLCGCNTSSFPSSMLSYISYPTAEKLFKNVKTFSPNTSVFWQWIILLT